MIEQEIQDLIGEIIAKERNVSRPDHLPERDLGPGLTLCPPGHLGLIAPHHLVVITALQG